MTKDIKTPSAQPISTLNTPLAQTYAYLHPLLLLGSLYYTLPDLINDPITTLRNTILPLGAFQAINAAVTLPSANELAYRAAEKRKPNPKPSNLGLGASIVPAILSFVIALTAGPPLLAAGLVLFGAPFTTHQFQTVLCGAHMALLAAVPLIYVHGVEAARWMDIVALKVPVDETLGAALGTLVGAWIGAVPIPLDWDREWQKWPVTVVVGAYAGYAVGKIVGGTVLKGKAIKF